MLATSIKKSKNFHFVCFKNRGLPDSSGYNRGTIETRQYRCSLVFLLISLLIIKKNQTLVSIKITAVVVYSCKILYFYKPWSLQNIVTNTHSHIYKHLYLFLQNFITSALAGIIDILLVKKNKEFQNALQFLPF